MEQIAVFEEKVTLAARDFHNPITSFNKLLLGKLKKQLEGKCSTHGYVIPDSLELLSRSLGYAEKGRFTSEFLYYIKAQGKVYNPPEGLKLEGEVVRKNKMGLYVIVADAIRIMIPRDLHIGNPTFDKVDIGDRIKIEIKKSRFQVNDTHILSIGQFLGMAGEVQSGLSSSSISTSNVIGVQEEEEEEEDNTDNNVNIAADEGEQQDDSEEEEE